MMYSVPRMWTEFASIGVYSALVDKELPIEYGDYFKDAETGLTYRVTSNPSEKGSPKSATFALKYFTAERRELP